MKRQVEVAILRTLALAFAVAVLPVAAQPPDSDLPAYKDTHLPFELRATDLVSRMTLEEKASQLVNDAAAIPRLGLREYKCGHSGDSLLNSHRVKHFFPENQVSPDSFK